MIGHVSTKRTGFCFFARNKNPNGFFQPSPRLHMHRNNNMRCQILADKPAKNPRWCPVENSFLAVRQRKRQSSEPRAWHLSLAHSRHDHRDDGPWARDTEAAALKQEEPWHGTNTSTMSNYWMPKYRTYIMASSVFTPESVAHEKQTECTGARGVEMF